MNLRGSLGKYDTRESSEMRVFQSTPKSWKMDAGLPLKSPFLADIGPYKSHHIMLYWNIDVG